MPGYTLIEICIPHTGLAVYLEEYYKHKLVPFDQHTKTWEVFFVETEDLKKLIPPRERNEHCLSLTHSEKYDNEIILTGDHNINLL